METLLSTTLSGNFNPSYISNTLSQSGVDTSYFIGDSIQTWEETVSFFSPVTSTFFGSFRNIVDDIILSGNTLFFSGAFANDITNKYYSIYWNYPPEQINPINIGYFDTTKNRIYKFKNIGNFTNPILSTLSADTLTFDRVFSLALCGNNLVAAGKFSLVNTEITGFQNLFSTVPYSAISASPLVTYGAPFTTNISVNQIIPLTAYKLLASNPSTILYSDYFFPTLSGDPCTNVTYYSQAQQKWLPFIGSKTMSGRIRDVEVRNNVVYVTGRTDRGAVFFHNGSDWTFLSNTWSMSSLSGNFSKYAGTSLSLRLTGLGNKMEGLSLNYDSSNDRMIFTGAFSGYDNDYRKTGIMSYNFNTASFDNIGSGINIPTVFSTVLCGGNIAAFGSFIDPNLDDINKPFMAAYIEPNGSFFKKFDTNIFYVNDGGYCLYTGCLCGYNIVVGGKFDTFDGVNDNKSYVGFFNKNRNFTAFNVLPNGPFTNTNPFKTVSGELSAYEPVVRKVFEYMPMNYTIGTGISGDFTSLNLYNNDTIQSGTGITVFGNSTLLGINGINVDF